MTAGGDLGGEAGLKPAGTPMTEYAAVRDRAYEAMTRGQLKLALHLYAEARQLAAECDADDSDIVDKADVNLAMARLEVREPEQDEIAERGLREVLLRSANEDVIRLAAHCLARVHSHRGEHDKALRFARLGLEKATALGEPLKIASGLQLLAAVHAAHSDFEVARDFYEQALDVLERQPLDEPARQAFYHAIILDALGYVLVVLGDLEAGRARIEAALAESREHGITDVVAEAESDLCHVHLLLGNLETARDHGEEALRLSEAEGYRHLRRNCYYLLGEVHARLGDDERAREFYRKLGSFYPDVPFIEQFLRQYDVSSLINLKEFA